MVNEYWNSTQRAPLSAVEGDAAARGTLIARVG
jgi:hypothetical protein